MIGSLFHRLAEVVIGSDVVAVEDGTRSVSTDHHRDTFTNSGANHVSDSGSPKVVKEPRGNHHGLFNAIHRDGDGVAVSIELRLHKADRFAGGSPGSSEIPD